MQKEGISKVNPLYITACVGVIQGLRSSGISPVKITVITYYAAQRQAYRLMLPSDINVQVVDKPRVKNTTLSYWIQSRLAESITLSALLLIDDGCVSRYPGLEMV